MTTSRMIVVLRSELGVQYSLALKEYKALEAIYLPIKHLKKEKNPEALKAYKLYDQAWGKVTRLEKATEALGAIQLGDIEDKDF